MRRIRALRVGTVLTACGLTVACGGPTKRLPTTPGPPIQQPPPPPVNNTISYLTGRYKLTIDLPNSCSELSEAARRRNYDATIEARNGVFLDVRVVGEGYAASTVTGDMMIGAEDRPTLDWNNEFWHLGGCDGPPETLPDGSKLIVCGMGWVDVEGTSMTAKLSGKVFLEQQGTRRQICSDGSLLTFRRAE